MATSIISPFLAVLAGHFVRSIQTTHLPFAFTVALAFVFPLSMPLAFPLIFISPIMLPPFPLLFHGRRWSLSQRSWGRCRRDRRLGKIRWGRSSILRK